jgi:hypothetical protein
MAKGWTENEWGMIGWKMNGGWMLSIDGGQMDGWRMDTWMDDVSKMDGR